MNARVQRSSVMPGSALDGSNTLKTQLAGVPNDAWTAFVHALTINDDSRDGHIGQPRHFEVITSSGGYGCFDLRPRRLADLGVMRNIRVDNASGRAIVVGEFISPLTTTKLLKAPLIQYNILLESLRRYDKSSAEPIGMSRSGQLALLHRLGPMAVAKWQQHQEPATVALFRRTNDLF